MGRFRIGLGALVLAVIGCIQLAEAAKKPRLPPGQDPGGMAVAVLVAGIDYTVPRIAARLARDGEGDLIAWDVLDGDNRPFLATGEGTDGELIDALVAHAGWRLVPVRIDFNRLQTIEAALAFVAASPARFVFVPLALVPRDRQRFLEIVASRFPAVTVVAVAGHTATADGKAENLVTVSAGPALAADINVDPGADKTGLDAASAPAQVLARLVQAARACDGAGKLTNALQGKAKPLVALFAVGRANTRNADVTASCPIRPHP